MPLPVGSGGVTAGWPGGRATRRCPGREELSQPQTVLRIVCAWRRPGPPGPSLRRRRVAVKVEGAVKRGAKAAAKGVEKDAHAAGRAVDKAARKIGLPTASASAPAKVRPHGG